MGRQDARVKRAGLLIQGNFKPSKETQVFASLSRVLGILLLACLGVSMLVYGIGVHVESEINDLGKKTRAMTEENKELQVKLNRIQSFKNVEVAAGQLPQLHLAEEVIEIPLAINTYKLPELPERRGALPDVQGY